MGLVKVAAGLGPRQEELTEVEFLVDTGSLYTVISPALAAELGIAFGDATTRIVTADGARRDMPVTVAYMRLEDREAGILVGALESRMPLLGATSLQALGLKVNPVKETVGQDRSFPDIFV